MERAATTRGVSDVAVYVAGKIMGGGGFDNLTCSTGGAMRRMNGAVIEGENGATIIYPNGMDLSMTKTEMERLRAIKARPEEAKRKQRSRAVPRTREFNVTQKQFYAEVFGDDETIEVFGPGPWLKSERKAAALRRAKGKGRSE